MAEYVNSTPGSKYRPLYTGSVYTGPMESPAPVLYISEAPDGIVISIEARTPRPGCNFWAHTAWTAENASTSRSRYLRGIILSIYIEKTISLPYSLLGHSLKIEKPPHACGGFCCMWFCPELYPAGEREVLAVGELGVLGIEAEAVAEYTGIVDLGFQLVGNYVAVYFGNAELVGAGK